MLGWIYRLLIGRFSHCKHQYMIVSKSTFNHVNGSFSREIYTLQCKHCGNIKQKTII